VSWMVIMGIGAVLGVAALVGIFWSLRKLEAPKKWGALVASLALGAGGAFMVINATALGTVDGEQEAIEEMDDFDAPLEDDWGDEGWGDEAGGDQAGGDEAGGDQAGGDDWADEEGWGEQDGDPLEGVGEPLGDEASPQEGTEAATE
jgi:hypothetical protein